MTEITPNDKAFIKVSEEMIRKQNDLEVLKKLETIAGSLNEWSRKTVAGVQVGRAHSEDLQGISHVVSLLGNISELKKTINKTSERIEVLKDMADSYLKGQDIVASRLARD